VNAYAALDETLELTIVNASSRVLLANLIKGAASEQAAIFRGFAERLKGAGADVAIVTSLAGHFCIRELENVSPLPVVNALPALDRHFGQLGVNRVGLLGTRTVMESKLYGGISSAEVVFPQGADLDTVHETYVATAIAGSATNEQKELLIGMGEKLCREQGADAVALAGTDLFLAFDGAACGYRVIDCARVHIDDIVAHALSDASE
jgi:aspartate racemase